MQALTSMLPILLMFGVFYFIVIRPQVRKQREMQEMLKKLDKGEWIITRGGVIGKITGSTGDILVVEIQDKVRVRIPRAYVEGRWDEAASKVTDVAAAPGKAA